MFRAQLIFALLSSIMLLNSLIVGSEPNDRIDVSEITAVKDKVDAPSGKVASVESKENPVAVKPIKNRHKYTVVGTYDRSTFIKSGTTIQECMKLCESRRMKDPTWNGVIWSRSIGSCVIIKNDDLSALGKADFLHFRAE